MHKKGDFQSNGKKHGCIGTKEKLKGPSLYHAFSIRLDQSNVVQGKHISVPSELPMFTLATENKLSISHGTIKLTVILGSVCDLISGIDIAQMVINCAKRAMLIDRLFYW